MKNDMTLEAFSRLLDVHGGDPSRWPRETRAAMEALCAREADARRMLEEARALDDLLTRSAPPPAEIAGLQESILRAAGLAEAASPAGAASMPPPANDNRAPGWLAGGVLAASLLLGVWLGGFGPLAPVGEKLLGGPVRVAALDDSGLGDILEVAGEPEDQGGTP